MNELINKHQQQAKMLTAATPQTKTDASTTSKDTPAPNMANSASTAPATDAKHKAAMLDALVKQLSGQGKPEQTEVSSSQRLDAKTQQLLSKTNPTLAAQIQNYQQSAVKTGAGLPQQIQAQTQTQQQQSTPLYLVKLSQINAANNQTNNQTVTGTNKPTLLTTITPTPFKVGDQLQLQLNSQQQITIKPSVASVRPIIADSLKSALPQQQHLSQLLNTLATISKLPAVTQDVLLAKNTQTALQQLNQFVYNDKQLNSINSIKNALTNSGVLTENKLQQQQPISGDLRATLGQLSQALSSQLSSQLSGQLTTSTEFPMPKATFDQLITQLIQQLPPAIATTSSAASSQQVLQQVTAIMQLFGFKTDANMQADMSKIREATAKKLGQMAQGVQDKILLNQLRLLGVESQANDNYVANHAANKSNAFIAEIALRWGDQILPLQLSIAEEKEHKRDSDNREENENSDRQKEEKLTRRWQVFMSFDLPGTLTSNNSTPKTDTLHSQLTIVGDTISATLWSESSTLCQKAKQQFSTLRNTLIANGLQVDELQCINGKPPSQKMALDYHLVDITT